MFAQRDFSARNSRRSSLNSTKNSSRRSSAVSVLDDIDKLYNIKDFQKLKKLEEISAASKSSKRRNSKVATVTRSSPVVDEEAESETPPDIKCCTSVRRSKYWKPFKKGFFFILHFVLVMVVLFCGAVALAAIEDPPPPDTTDSSTADNNNNAQILNHSLGNISHEFWEALKTNYTVNITTEEDRNAFLGEVSNYLSKRDQSAEETKHNEELKDRWFILSKWVYFVTIACTTIGYGDVAPKTDDGRFFYIIFSIVGIPLMMSLLKSCGALITAVNKKFFAFLNECLFREDPLVSEQLLSSISTFILFVCYVTAGCLFNAAVSGWPLFTSIYYWIVTFTTVGFGDVHHDLEDQVDFLSTLLVYRVFGLAMLAAVIDSIFQYMEFRKKDLKKRMKEKKLRMRQIYAKKSKNFARRHFGQQDAVGDGTNYIKKNKTTVDPAMGSKRNRSNTHPIFDARVHEPIFGTGDLEYQQSEEEEEEEEESDGSTDSASEYETE